MRIADPTKQVGNTRVYRGSGLEAALTDLINLPAPCTPVSSYSNPINRSALRATLDMTPTLLQRT